MVASPHRRQLLRLLVWLYDCSRLVLQAEVRCHKLFCAEAKEASMRPSGQRLRAARLLGFVKFLQVRCKIKLPAWTLIISVGEYRQRVH